MIIISSPIAIANEIDIIHSLFEEGMELFHVRKPLFSAAEMKQFVSKIRFEFRSKLVLHQQHNYSKTFGINRLHFTEKSRMEITKFSSKYSLENYKANDFILSASVHTMEDFNALSDAFDYAFLAPVFKSISKENYEPKMDFSSELKKRTNFKTKLIALGGIQSENINQALSFGFEDVALLGTIWNNNNPIENFKSCQQIVLSH